MLQFGHCPRCNTPIAQDRKIDQAWYCSCGWSASIPAHNREDSYLENTTLALLATGALMILAFVQVVTWNQYSFSIVPKKLAQWTGTASISTLQSIADICLERKMPHCAAHAYGDIHARAPQDLLNLEKLAKIQVQLEDVGAALLNYQKYFAQGGKSLEAAYEYAKALGKTGNVQESSRYFEFVLSAKPGTFQISVSRAYVVMLVNNRRYQEARTMIHNLRKKGSNTAYFLDQELKEINKRLGV